MRIKTLAFATIVALATAAQAQVAYNSFLPGYGWDNTVGYGINGLGAPPKFIQSFAVGFEAAASGTVDQISVAVGFFGLGVGRNVRLELYDDDGTQQAMGLMLDSWDFVNTAPNNFGELFQIQNQGTAGVTQGEWYWMHMIALDEDGFHTWMFGDMNILCPGLISHDGGKSFSYSSVNSAPALEVTVVPEPATFVVLGVGILALLRRRITG
ncbi:MAG: PEP-CTERM sorting domain-containing protein [Fimbriimonadales bacterium]